MAKPQAASASGGSAMKKMMADSREKMDMHRAAEETEKDLSGDTMLTSLDECITPLLQLVKEGVARGEEAWSLECSRAMFCGHTLDDFIAAFARHARVLNTDDDAAAAAAAAAPPLYNVTKAARRLTAFATFFHEHRDKLTPAPTAEEIRPLMCAMDFAPLDAGDSASTTGAGTPGGERAIWVMNARNFTNLPALIEERDDGGLCQFRMMALAFHFCLFDPRYQEGGMSMVMALGGFSIASMFAMRSTIDKDVQKVNEQMFAGILPIRMASFYYVDSPWWMRLLLKLIRPLMSAKMRARVNVVPGASAGGKALPFLIEVRFD